MKHKLIKILSLSLALVTAVLFFTSCTDLSSTSQEAETVMTVGGFDVPYELYRYMVLNFKRDFPDLSDEELKKKTEAALLDMFAILKTAGDYGLSVDDEYFVIMADNAAKAAIQEAGGEDAYKKKLEESFMNDSVFRFLTKKDAVYEELYYAMEKAGKIETDTEKIKELAKSDGFVCVKQVLIVGENRGSTGDVYYKPAQEHTNEEAKTIAAGVREKALFGEDFDTLVRDYGESLYMMQNADGYYVCRGMWDDGVFDAVSALEVGEVSDVVESTAGFSVFLRCEKDGSYIENHAEKLQEDYGRAVFTLEIEKTRSELKIQPAEEYENIDIGEMMPGETK